MDRVILEILSPVADVQSTLFSPGKRLEDIAGKKIGLYWNSKIGGEVALAEIGEQLKSRFQKVAFTYFTATDFNDNAAFLHDLRQNHYDAFISSTGD